MAALGLAAVMSLTAVACGESGDGKQPESSQGGQTAKTEGKDLAGTTIRVYTHTGNRVLGEEKKDDDGNTYRDESSAYLAQLAEKFTDETGIKVELNVVTNEDEIRPLFQVEDPTVDVFTCPNWSLEEWAQYTEPYCTLEEGREVYGEYADAMPNDGKNIFSIMPGRAYNQAVVYNEEVIKAAGYDEIPGTLDEFNKMCEKIKENGVTPISLHRVENWPLATVQDFAGYVAGDAQFIADSGFIANKKGVTSIVPELYSIIDKQVEDGTCTALLSPATDDNTIANQEILTEAGLWADYKYVGLLFDALDVTKPDDWSAYDKQVETQNKAYAEYKEELGLEWKE